MAVAKTLEEPEGISDSDQQVRALCLVAASYQAPTPDTAITVAEEFVAWVRAGTPLKNAAEAVRAGHAELSDQELAEVRARQQEERDRRKAERREARLAEAGGTG